MENEKNAKVESKAESKEVKKIFLRTEVVEYLTFLKMNKTQDENVKKKKYKEIVGSVWENRQRVFSRAARFSEPLKKEGLFEILNEEIKNSGSSVGKRLSIEVRI
jgi:shikimate kinase